MSLGKTVTPHAENLALGLASDAVAQPDPHQVPGLASFVTIEAWLPHLRNEDKNQAPQR